ncbi:MAG: TonB-dependent receptor [Bacteroidota bacterium]
MGRDDPSDKGPYTLSGKVIDFETGDYLQNASVVIERQNMGTSSGLDGEFKFQLYQGVYTIKATTVGYKMKSRTFSIIGDGSLRFVLEPESFELEEVVVTSDNANSGLLEEAGAEILNLEKIKKLPPLAGEVDVIKSLTLLSGVNSQGEVSNNFSVRGGGGDQNLFLFNGTTIYNPSHLLGFFSSINANVINQVEFYKGTAPARFGGRASSVIDVKSKKGNFGQFGGNANLGIISSGASFYGPIINGKLAFYIAGRYAYPEWLIRRAGDPNIRESKASFWDGNTIFNYIIDDNNDLEFSYYRSFDEFVFSNNVRNDWVNEAVSFHWNTRIIDKLNGKLSFSNARYTPSLSQSTEISRSELASKLNHLESSADLKYLQSDKLTINFGGTFRYLRNNRGDLDVFRQGNLIDETKIEQEKAIETGIYGEIDFTFTNTVGLSLGLRRSSFSILGGNSYNTYDPAFSRSTSTITGFVEYSENEKVVSFSNFEPRITTRINTNIVNMSLGLSRNVQYLHLISNTTTSAPNDIWKFSDPYIDPQSVWQYSFGLSKDLVRKTYTLSIDSYYKSLKNLIEYKDGADLTANPTIETEIFNVDGEAYGIEVGLEKKVGKIRGQINYTYSRSLRLADSPFVVEQINRGSVYPSNLDIPHVVNLNMNFKFSPITTLNAIFIYGSGRLFTSPLGKFEFEGVDYPLFVSRNNDRTNAIHRLDLSLNIKLNGKNELGRGNLVLAIYNIYGQENPYSAFFQDFEGSPPGLYQLTIIDSAFPSISYAIEF